MTWSEEKINTKKKEKSATLNNFLIPLVERNFYWKRKKKKICANRWSVYSLTKRNKEKDTEKFAYHVG